MARDVWIGNFTAGQQPVVRRVADDLRRVGVDLHVSFSHRLRHIMIGGSPDEIARVEAALRAYGHDGTLADGHRRFARNAAEKVAARLKEDGHTGGSNGNGD